MDGRPRPQPHSPSASTRRRERWLVILGIVLHAVYMLSIFDIYFKSPIVHGMPPVPPRLSAPPAKRLVLLVADGLRADKFFEPDERGRYRAPFLRGVIEEKGRWGVSHARPPTESRPGHVAIIAGFYEDPSAVTKGWKANPVEFDSVFNQSRHTISYGSPDIVPIFCSSIPHSTWGSYPHEYEDFATDASFLDHWSFDQFEGLLNRSLHDVKLRQLLLQDKLVIFLHLLGCDSNGHAHRPYSSIYLNNVKVVDEIAEKMYNLMENYFNDNQTAYVFTADHGMSDKGSHGDGHPSNTDTPLVAWGAGIRSPKFLVHTEKPDDGFRFVDDHRHDMPTPQNWALEGFERVDVNQADIAPLMATLVGLPCPMNSVGNLPSHYLKLSKADEVEAVLANTKQILNQFLRKSEQKHSSSLYFKPFKPLVNYLAVLDQIEDLISARDYETAMKNSEELRSGCLFMGLSSIILLLEKSPLLYHAYVFMTIFLWTRIVHNLGFMKSAWRELSNLPFKYIMNLLISSVAALFILEFLVMSFFDRKLYTWCFLALGILASVYGALFVQATPAVAIYTWLTCWFLSIFTLMPAEIPENNNLVIFSGALIILIAMASRGTTTNTSSFWLYLNRANKRAPKFSKLFFAQVILIAMSSIMVWLTTSHRSLHKELHPLHQLINWCIAGFSMVLPLFSPCSVLSRLTSIFLGFAPPFLLLSIGYEAVFYSAFAMVLMGWIFLESANLYCSEGSDSTCYSSLADGSVFGYDERCLQLSDFRIPLLFMILFNVAFFGTGNFASIASFEISSVYRFITIFSPFLMAALLIFKLFIPYMLVM
uniref:Uncharacterized protein n=1 Tax=Avena sativa TaxID=4498 RepID=A0ACD5YT79_AVESA